MRLTKVFGLAAIAAVAAMAFIGTSTAGAIVLCKELVTTCPAGSQWPTGTQILGLATNPELLGGLAIKCADSTVVGETTAASGNPLPAKITSLAFGILPTPTLGAGCTGCPFGLITLVHANNLPFTASLELQDKTVDKYALVATGKATVLCTNSKHEAQFECGYERTILSPITHTGTHPLHSSSGNLPKIEINAALTLTLGSEFFCGSSATWDANYVIYLAHAGGGSGLAWPAL